MVKLFYTAYISVDLAHHEIFCAKVGKGRINFSIALNHISDQRTQTKHLSDCMFLCLYHVAPSCCDL